MSFEKMFHQVGKSFDEAKGKFKNVAKVGAMMSLGVLPNAIKAEQPATSEDNQPVAEAKTEKKVYSPDDYRNAFQAMSGQEANLRNIPPTDEMVEGYLKGVFSDKESFLKWQEDVAEEKLKNERSLMKDYLRSIDDAARDANRDLLDALMDKNGAGIQDILRLQNKIIKEIREEEAWKNRTLA